MDVEVGVFIIILIVVDEVHHFLVGTFALLDVHFPAPFIDCILEGVVNVVADILEWFTTGADRHHLGEEPSFIMDIIDLTARFTDSV